MSVKLLNDGGKADEQRYQDDLLKIQSNEQHSRHHYDPKIMKKVVQAKQDLNYEKPDKYEVLKDENI